MFSINWRDFLKGMVMAVGTPVLYVVQELIPHWPLNHIEQAGISALVTYLLKNLFTPAQIVVSNASKAEIEAIKSGDAALKVIDKETGKSVTPATPNLR